MTSDSGAGSIDEHAERLAHITFCAAKDWTKELMDDEAFKSCLVLGYKEALTRTECKECKEIHVEKATCEKCGACLYAHAKQIPDPEHPIFECTKCGQRTFWD